MILSIFMIILCIAGYVMFSTQCDHSWEYKGDRQMKCSKCKKRYSITGHKNGAEHEILPD